MRDPHLLLSHRPLGLIRQRRSYRQHRSAHELPAACTNTDATTLINLVCGRASILEMLCLTSRAATLLANCWAAQARHAPQLHAIAVITRKPVRRHRLQATARHPHAVGT